MIVAASEPSVRRSLQVKAPADPLPMKNPTYKLIELTGTSAVSSDDAVVRVLKRAHKTLKHLCWFQVIETRGDINKGKVDHWQVTIKVGFTVEG